MRALSTILFVAALVLAVSRAHDTLHHLHHPHHGTTAEAPTPRKDADQGTCTDKESCGQLQDNHHYGHHHRGLLPRLTDTIDSMFHWPTSDLFDSFPFHHRRSPAAAHHRPWWPLQQASHTLPATTVGAVDVVESEKEITIHADTPGMTTSDINVEVRGDLLTLSGERKESHCSEDKDTQAHRCERSFNSFHRSFRLPEEAEVSKIHATSKHGVLTVVVPKKAKAQDDTKTLKIPVHHHV